MLESLVSEHERILAERLQLVTDHERILVAPSQETQLPSGEVSQLTPSDDDEVPPNASDANEDDADKLSSEVFGVKRMRGTGKGMGRTVFRMSELAANLEAGARSDSWTSPTSKWIWETCRVREEVIEAVMGFAIFLDLIFLGISTRVSGSWCAWLDAALGGVFTAELFRRMCTQGCKKFLWGDAWRINVSEVFLVVLTWVDIIRTASLTDGDDDAFSLFLFLRLLRVARVLRVRVFGELCTMVDGIMGSYKTLLSSLVLISLPLYCVAMVLTETLGRSAARGLGAEKFQHLEESLFTVFRCFVASDCTQEDGKPLFVLVTETYGWVYGVLYCIVQFLITFGLSNIVTGIYVEKSVCAAKFNDLTVKRRRFQDRQYFDKQAKAMLLEIWKLYEHADSSKRVSDIDPTAIGQLQLTRGFFEKLCNQPSFTNILRSLDISEDDQLGLFDTLDVNGRGTIDPLSLVLGVRHLRGEARKADIVSMALILRSVQSKLLEIEGMLERQRFASNAKHQCSSTRSSALRSMHFRSEL